MDNKVKSFKLFSKAEDLNEYTVYFINNHCLQAMTNQEMDFSIWSIGVTNQEDIICDKKWECATAKEANDTKRYFTEYKTIKNLDGEGIFIYIIKDSHKLDEKYKTIEEGKAHYSRLASHNDFANTLSDEDFK